jgi:hypothetical protein
MMRWKSEAMKRIQSQRRRRDVLFWKFLATRLLLAIGWLTVTFAVFGILASAP